MAGKQGLCEGDEILEINGGEVAGLDWIEKEKLKKVIAESRPLSLKVWHKPVAIWGGMGILEIQAIAAENQKRIDITRLPLRRPPAARSCATRGISAQPNQTKRRWHGHFSLSVPDTSDSAGSGGKKLGG